MTNPYTIKGGIALFFICISLIENENDRGLAEQIYMDYAQAMFRKASSILGNDIRAEDAVSDAFERICLNIEKFRELDCNKTRALIVTYTRNVCFNMLRRDNIIKFTAIEDDFRSENQTESIVFEKADYDRFLKLVKSLEHNYKEVLRLRYFVGLTDIEIANTLNITPENVRVRLSRARRKLRQLLMEEKSNE